MIIICVPSHIIDDLYIYFFLFAYRIIWKILCVLCRSKKERKNTGKAHFKWISRWKLEIAFQTKTKIHDLLVQCTHWTSSMYGIVVSLLSFFFLPQHATKLLMKEISIRFLSICVIDIVQIPYGEREREQKSSSVHSINGMSFRKARDYSFHWSRWKS